jgi:hypothetical protein
MMQKILNTSKLVKMALTVCPETRNSDSYLYLKVIEQQAIDKGMDIRTIPLPYFLANFQRWGFAPFETVRRTRQKIQAEFPELASTSKVAASRADQEEKFFEYSKLKGV